MTNDGTIDRDNEDFNEGVNHTVELLAKALGVSDWYASDGSEDYDTDLQRTLLNILVAKGLYDDETAAFAHLPQIASFQSRVAPWMQACFGPATAADVVERNHRFLEEALELVQACGCTAEDCHRLVDYVFGRPTGQRFQEVGGVMVTLSALCLAQAVDLEVAAETELARVWTKIDQIRAKQAAKPKGSPLPIAEGASS